MSFLIISQVSVPFHSVCISTPSSFCNPPRSSQLLDPGAVATDRPTFATPPGFAVARAPCVGSAGSPGDQAFTLKSKVHTGSPLWDAFFFFRIEARYLEDVVVFFFRGGWVQDICLTSFDL